MRSLSESLTILIATAEDITRRSFFTMPTKLAPVFAEIAAEIRRADQAPCDGVRATRAGVVMVTAIEAFFAADSSDYWQMLIGAALPLLRRDAWQALRNEKEARPG